MSACGAAVLDVKEDLPPVLQPKKVDIKNVPENTLCETTYAKLLAETSEMLHLTPFININVHIMPQWTIARRYSDYSDACVKSSSVLGRHDQYIFTHVISGNQLVYGS